MASRRAPHQALPSPLTLLDALAPAYRTLCLAGVGVSPACPHARALNRAVEALAQLAADLGHERYFSARPPGR